MAPNGARCEEKTAVAGTVVNGHNALAWVGSVEKER